ncbi:sulfatase-like hydrolase/transferase [Clostridium intestinale]|uniref:sulfatase-like hydrolase/transferase n=1 Tax=Clostridium intestinale TaxID=36845 RepID=UPI000A04E4BD|nr:sulfatase-like hydrolase/transferase [Clostridium intestinale]
MEDNEFLAQSLETLKELQEPFFSFIVTLSSRHPFDMFKDFNEFDLGEFAGTQLADYIEAIHYTDKAIGNFIDALKKKAYLILAP